MENFYSRAICHCNSVVQATKEHVTKWQLQVSKAWDKGVGLGDKRACDMYTCKTLNYQKDVLREHLQATVKKQKQSVHASLPHTILS